MHFLLCLQIWDSKFLYNSILRSPVNYHLGSVLLYDRKADLYCAGGYILLLHRCRMWKCHMLHRHMWTLFSLNVVHADTTFMPSLQVIHPTIPHMQKHTCAIPINNNKSFSKWVCLAGSLAQAYLHTVNLYFGCMQTHIYGTYRQKLHSCASYMQKCTCVSSNNSDQICLCQRASEEQSIKKN